MKYVGYAYGIFVVAVVTLFTVSSLRGWRLGDTPREHVPASVRSSPGGYRSFHFWHTGFSGGK